jgi:hypothetical protein
MTNIKKKAIFYAYSNNALDHLAPYVFLCHQKKMNCVVIYGEDFARHKVKPKSNIVKIFADQNINTYHIANFTIKGFLQTIYLYLWPFSRFIDKHDFIPIFFKFNIRRLCNRIYERIDLESIGKNIALKLLKNTDKALIFTDRWNINKKIQNNFLLYMKGKATIISTNHTPYHFTFQRPIEETPVLEDIKLLGNHWEETDDKSLVKSKVTIGSLRYSKKWMTILDQYSEEKIPKKNHKKNVLIIAHNKTYTSDWKRMLELLSKLAKREDVNLRILPHVRGMINMEPPTELKNAWDKTSTLDVAVKKADIVIFWVSSGFFEAVIRNKKVLYLSFLSTLDGKFIWQKKAPNNIVIKNEIELFNELSNYDKKEEIDNSCFNEIIWPNGDPWGNASNFLDKLLNTN